MFSSLNRSLAAAVALLVGLALVPAPAGAQKVDKKAQEKLDKQKRQQYAALATVVDGMMAGQPAPADVTIEWTQEFALKAQDNKSYVPFTVGIDPPEGISDELVMYLRVAPRGATTPEGDDKTGPNDTKDRREAAPVVYPFENLYTLKIKGSSRGQQVVSRAFDAVGGEYDVYVVVAERARGTKDPALGRMGGLKQSLTVPDFWGSDLTTSPVLLVDRIDPLSAPLSQEQQVERPFALGGMEVTPAGDHAFTKTEELFPIFFVYNSGVNDDGKPHLEVEYHFHHKVEGNEKFFNRTNPQVVNASTLPPQFDVRAGHQVMVAQAVPLQSFPEGDYRLEIKLTDKLSGKSLSRDVAFTVTP
jgi:hypothetical protein